jgi:hypothetical protein
MQYNIMPLSKVNYANTIIYRIFSDNCDYVYVGSTTNFVARKAKHKSNYTLENSKSYNLKVYQTIRENGGWDNFKMLEIEEYPCENSKQSRKREQYWIDFYKSNLNTCKAFVAETKKEYNKQYQFEHAEEIKQQTKQYRVENAEQIKQQKAKDYQLHKEELNQKITCECGAIISKQYLTTHKKSKKHLEAI